MTSSWLISLHTQAPWLPLEGQRGNPRAIYKLLYIYSNILYYHIKRYNNIIYNYHCIICISGKSRPWVSVHNGYTHIDHPGSIASAHVEEHRGLVEVGQHGHVLDHVKLGRIQLLNVTILHCQGLSGTQEEWMTSGSWCYTACSMATNFHFLSIHYGEEGTIFLVFILNDYNYYRILNDMTLLRITLYDSELHGIIAITYMPKWSYLVVNQQWVYMLHCLPSHLWSQRWLCPHRVAWSQSQCKPPFHQGSMHAFYLTARTQRGTVLIGPWDSCTIVEECLGNVPVEFQSGVKV